MGAERTDMWALVLFVASVVIAPNGRPSQPARVDWRDEIVGPAVVLMSTAWMYVVCQWSRVDPDITGALPTITAMAGFGLMAAGFACLLPLKATDYLGAVAFGVTIGVVADAAWPLAGGAESNLWPIAIVLWCSLAMPAWIIGVLGGQWLRRRRQGSG